MRQRHEHRQRMDPVDRRTTSALLAILLGFISGILIWSFAWPYYREHAAPSAEALENGDWPTGTVVIVSLLILAALIATLIFSLFWLFQRLRKPAASP